MGRVPRVPKLPWANKWIRPHVYAEALHDQSDLIQIVQDTTVRYEQTMPLPWTLTGSAEFLNQLAGAIVGFYIDISRIEGKWKLSQNHSPNRRERIIRGLLGSTDPGAHDVARLMRETLDVPTGRET
jgi:transcriptional regulator